MCEWRVSANQCGFRSQPGPHRVCNETKLVNLSAPQGSSLRMSIKRANLKHLLHGQDNFQHVVNAIKSVSFNVIMINIVSEYLRNSTLMDTVDWK